MEDFKSVYYQGYPILSPLEKSMGLTFKLFTKVLHESSIPSVLSEPDLLHKIKLELDKDVVGEDENKLLLFLIGLTSFSDTPLGALITGESSSGKSRLMDGVLNHFPNVEEYSRMTQASPDRIGKNFSNKILKVSELHGTEKAQATLRVWISEGKLNLLTTTKDEDGNITTAKIETTGIPVFVTTTTSFNPDQELENRLFLISTDQSPELTRKVIQAKAKRFSQISPQEPGPNRQIVQVIEALVTNPTRVVIPFSSLIGDVFPCDTVKARRDFDKIMWITQAIAFLYQFQRPKFQALAKWKGFFTVALPIDFCMAWTMAEQGIKETLLGVQNRALEVLKHFRIDDDKTANDVAVDMGKNQDYIRRMLNALVSRGFLIRSEEKRPYKYRLFQKTDDLSDIEYLSVDLDRFTLEELKTWHDREATSDFSTCKEQWKDTFTNPITGETLSVKDFVARGKKSVVGSSSTPKSNASTINTPEPTDISSMLPNSDGAKQSAEQLKKLREMTQKEE